jgi:uncharacterized membrane protein (UPF0182 family)
LFFIQAQVYRTYHMKSAEVFYNREDLWQFPRQPTGGDEATMAPYYIIVRLPGEPQAEFLQMLPMVPSQRQNMIAWLAARSDAPEYGKLIVYEFPKDKSTDPFRSRRASARTQRSPRPRLSILEWRHRRRLPPPARSYRSDFGKIAGLSRRCASAIADLPRQTR